MRKNYPFRSIILTTLLASSLFTQVSAQHIVSSSQNTERTNRLTSQIKWHQSLALAQGDARREHKMIFWVNMLGSLSGAT